MKLSLLEVKQKHSALNNIGAKKLPPKLAHAIGRTFMELDKENDVINKTVKKLLESHAEKDEEGNPKKREDGTYEILNEQEVDAEYKKYLEEEVEIGVRTVPNCILDELEDARYDMLTVAEMVAIDFLLEYPQETVIEEVEPKA